MMPRPMPRIIAPTVPKIVPFHRPSMTGVCCMISNANGKFHFSFVTNELMIIATTIAIDDHGHPAPGVPDRPGVDGARPVLRRRGHGVS